MRWLPSFALLGLPLVVGCSGASSDDFSADAATSVDAAPRDGAPAADVAAADVAAPDVAPGHDASSSVDASGTSDVGAAADGSPTGSSDGCTPSTCGSACGTLGDGCGQTISCGGCPSGSTCTANVCVPNGCVPDCGGRTCGPDPVCGTSCGTCASPETCGGAGTTGVCGAPGSNVYKAGSRLRLQSVSSGDGLTSYFGIYDQQLGTPCEALVTNDGALRCFPTPEAYTGYYSDSGCTTLVGFAQNVCGGTAPTYATAEDAFARHIAYPITGPYSGVVYQGVPGDCTAFAAPQSYSFYALAAQASASTFAALTELDAVQSPSPSSTDLEQSGTRLGVRAITSADGLVWPEAFGDQSLDVDCSFGRAGDQTERCLPAGIAYVDASLFSDAACTDPILDWAPNLGAPSYAEQEDADYCPTAAYFRVGASFTGTVYASGGGTCSALAPESGSAYYDLTPVAASTFEAATLATGAGPFAGFTSGSRLQITTATGADGSRGLAALYDTQLGLDCTFAVATDGAPRCLPLGALAYIQDFYGDPACTSPIVSGSCVAPSYAASTTSCSSTYYRVGALFTGTPYFLADNGECGPLTSPSPFYTLGAAVPASTFAEGTLSAP